MLALGGPEADLLKRVRVRRLREPERAEFDRWLEGTHDLHESVLLGQSLRAVAQRDGQGVALFALIPFSAFSAAALRLQAREAWLGWSPRQRARRLGLVVNNSRFLVLPERPRFPNLASRALGWVYAAWTRTGRSAGGFRCGWWKVSWTNPGSGSVAATARAQISF